MELRKNAKIELIKRIPLFRHCSRKDLSEIAAIADELDLKAGAMLTREGRGGREFIVIVDGEADVLIHGDWVNSLGRGDFLGEIALLTDQPRTASVKASSPMRVLVITRQNFSRLLGQSPEIQGKIMRSMADRLAANAL